MKVGGKEQQAEDLGVMLNRQGRETVTPLGSTAAFDDAVRSLKRKKENERVNKNVSAGSWESVTPHGVLPTARSPPARTFLSQTALSKLWKQLNSQPVSCVFTHPGHLGDLL